MLSSKGKQKSCVVYFGSDWPCTKEWFHECHNHLHGNGASLCYFL